MAIEIVSFPIKHGDFPSFPKKIRRVKISSDCGLQDCVALGFHRDDLSVARRCWKASMGKW
jgi:hypothetical protein